MKELNETEILAIAHKYKVKINAILCQDQIESHRFYDGWYIMNFDVSTGVGSHWVIFYWSDKLKLYFDSFGFVAPKILNVKLWTYYYNMKEIQSLNSTSCGWWCLYLAIYMKKKRISVKSFSEFIGMFKSKNEIYNEHLLTQYFS